MSFKAKDLQFDNAEPAFLRRLRGELSGEKAGRHEQPIPRNKRMKNDDDDDAPTYLLEDTNQSLTKEEFDALVSGKESKEQEKSSADESREEQAGREKTPKDKIAEVGASKKRKIAKVVHVDQEPPGDAENKNAQVSNVKAIKKQKKKGKAVKLAFDDEEEI